MNDFDNFYNQAELAFGTEPTREIRQHVESTERRGRALDLGAGDGRNALYLARAGYEVTAVDLSCVGLAKLERFARREGLMSRIKTVCADARNAVYKESSYDLVVVVTLFDHLPRKDVGALLDRIVASIRAGGALFVKVHTVDDPGFNRNGEAASELSRMILHYFEPMELLQMVNGDLDVMSYNERSEQDTSHGAPHRHGFATMLARKADG